MSTGVFVTVDGPGGCGKSSVVTALDTVLAARGHHVHPTAEPSTSPIGVFTRAHADQITGRALACLVAADRHHHLDHEIRPALSQGRTVVCDRYLASTLVLQRLDGVPEDYLLALNTGIHLPDLAVILTAAPKTITARLTARGAHHRFEYDPGTPARELTLYQDAARTLGRLGVRVITVDTDHRTPTEAARQIAGYLPDRTGSVGRATAT
ncbi:dTMP kinase [Streptomyces mobaraensis]|uniref:Thymidylate kinase n=1 Tax=Streptomyces mobaraensis TaxID=35621 RepID=A0A5N5W8R9_STRMB|nr:dTMP kinase [Streptomyces mobaraensis]KAB7845532.1 dTMP kinase [Streptomyces mobaraensis]